MPGHDCLQTNMYLVSRFDLIGWSWFSRLLFGLRLVGNNFFQCSTCHQKFLTKLYFFFHKLSNNKWNVVVASFVQHDNILRNHCSYTKFLFSTLSVFRLYYHKNPINLNKRLLKVSTDNLSYYTHRHVNYCCWWQQPFM